MYIFLIAIVLFIIIEPTSKCETTNAWCLLLSSTGRPYAYTVHVAGNYDFEKNQHFRVRFG